MPQNHLFEIPQELRRLAEDNVDRARRLYLQFMDGVSQAMTLWSAPSSDVITAGFQEVRERAVKFAKENADAAFALARDVSKAKDLRELLSLQTRYVQSQMRWYADQTQEFAQLAAKAMVGIKQAQNLQTDHRPAGLPIPKPTEITEEITKLTLKGFSIEVETEPLTLVLQTDKGPFSVAITSDQLSKLVYALRFVLYAEEPLQRKRQKQEKDGEKPAKLVAPPSRPHGKSRKKKK
jgi:hypothetical protein